MNTCDQTIKTLQAHADELRAMGVMRLALFGSNLRGDARPDSDIDLLVDFDAERHPSLVDFAELRVQRSHLKPFLRSAILDEARDIL